MIGPEKGRYREKVARLVADAEAAERAGFTSIWVPQIPGDFDALTAVALMGRATTRIELGTAVVPIQTRHPVAMAQQALSTQAVCEGRFTLGLGASHHWIVEDMLGLPYERPAHQMRNYLEVLNAAFAGPGPVDVENDGYRVHNPLDVTDIADADPARGAGAGDAPHRRRADVGHDPLDGRRARDRRARRPAHHEGCRRGRATGAADRRRRPGRAVLQGRGGRRARVGEPGCSGMPSTRRTTSACSSTATPPTSATCSRRATSRRSSSGCAASATRASTDLSVRVLPLGRDRAARIESKRRTVAFLASLCPEL